jgi:hypothetical protein
MVQCGGGGKRMIVLVAGWGFITALCWKSYRAEKDLEAQFVVGFLGAISLVGFALSVVLAVVI